MKPTVFLLFLISFLTLTACSNKKPVTATIHVTLGDPPQVETNEFALKRQTTIVTSYDFLSDVAEKLELPKKWNLSKDITVAKLSQAITVHIGSEPGLFVVAANNLDHQTSVDVLNELCSFYAGKEMWVSENGSSRRRVNMTIVQAAK
jgi:hypothetical protein